MPPEDVTWLARQLRGAVEAKAVPGRARVLLCGGSPLRANTARSKFQRFFEMSSNHVLFEVHLPEEDLESMLLLGDKSTDLLSVENALADSVDAVLLIPESPGSISELGAFANHARLRERLFVLVDKKHCKNRSFIMQGPIQLLRRTGKNRVFVEDLDNLDEKAIEHISKAILQFIWRGHRRVVDLSKVLDAKHFILACLYVLEPLSKDDLKVLLNKGTDVQEAEACISACIRSLLEEGVIKLDIDGFRASASTALSLVQHYDSSRLDAIRVEVLTFEHRRKRIHHGAEDGISS